MINKPQFPAETLALAHKMMARYPEGKHKSAILPILHLAQAEWGWLSPEVMDYVAEILSIEPIEVYEVATFYTMFHVDPVGSHVLEICRTGPCCLLGADELITHLENKLGIKMGETTPDGKFTLKGVECLAACGFAPVVQVREQYFENVNPAKADEMLQFLDTNERKQLYQELPL